MSLYNQIFGVNPFAALLLGGRKWPEIPRFRDVFIDTAGRLVLLTRTGGNNRRVYATETATLRSTHGYMADENAPFDNTFAHFYYTPPPGIDVSEIRRLQGPRGLLAFKALIEDLNAGRDTVLTRRAIEAGRPIIAAIEDATGSGARITIIMP